MSTIKWILLFFLSTGIGTFVYRIMENININIWVSRATGCLVSLIVALLLYKYFNRR
ncbi:hypothetical protein MHI59_29015 [Bacillus sp. FSL K6-2822]|uniref:hypothetical protein n=1 Tax=Bacillus sp. FSL K6-2822 TaxID=2921478 RepID=UPI0030FBE338